MIKRTLLAVALALLMLNYSCTETPEGVDDEFVEGDDGAVEEEEEEEEQEEEVLSGTFAVLLDGENDDVMFASSSYATGKVFTRTIYVDADEGDDTNSGLSIDTPIKTLTRLAEMGVVSGDEVLLKGSKTSEHRGTIRIVDGTGADPIHIGSYGDCKARLNAQGEFAGVLVQSTSNVIITDLKITADGYPTGVYGTNEGDEKCPEGDRPADCSKDLTSRYGVLLYAASGQKISDLVVYNVDIHDIFYFNKGDSYSAMDNRPCREWSTSYETEYGWGIRIYAAQSSANIDNCIVDSCNIHNVSHTGIKSNNNGTVTNLWITKTNLYDCGGPGSQFNKVSYAKMDYCNTVRPGSSKTDGVIDNRKWGRGSGMWCHTCTGFLFEHNYYYRSEGVADCCGAHMDIGNSNVIIQYCLSVDNCGGFIEILGKNYNCCYRYNISIDDGWRNVKYDELQQAEIWGAESVGSYGCLVTINGHTGDEYEGPYNTYVYNNTIITSENRYDGYINGNVVEFATSAKGIYFANNILYVPLKSDVNDGRFITAGSTHSKSEDGTNYYPYEKAVDYRKGESYVNDKGYDKVNTVYMSNTEISALDHTVVNNLYMTYDEVADKSLYPYAENVLYDNSNPLTDSDTKDARYRDLQPRSGNPGFPFVGGKRTDLYVAEDAIPTNSDVVNRGESIYKLSVDTSSNGIYCETYNGEVVSGLYVTRDYFDNYISTKILGACIVQ